MDVLLPLVKAKLPLLAMETAPPLVVMSEPLMAKFVPVNWIPDAPLVFKLPNVVVPLPAV